MTPPLYYSCCQLLSSLPPRSLLFGSISFSPCDVVSKSSPFSLSLIFSYPSFSIIFFHIALYPHKSSTLLIRALPLSAFSLTSDLSPSLPPASLSLSVGAVMVHSATVFVSASFPEWLCLYLNIRNTFLEKLQKTICALFRMSNALFTPYVLCIHINSVYIYETICAVNPNAQGKNEGSHFYDNLLTLQAEQTTFL